MDVMYNNDDRSHLHPPNTILDSDVCDSENRSELQLLFRHRHHCCQDSVM